MEKTSFILESNNQQNPFKMKKTCIAFITVSVLFISCLPTIYPLYHQEDLIYLKELIGNWQEAKASSTLSWFIEHEYEEDPEKYKHDLYHIEMVEDGDTLEYVGGLVQLDDEYYLDLKLYELDVSGPLVQGHIYAVHTIWRLQVRADSLIIHPFNSKWLIDKIENNQVRIKHENPDGAMIITAGTDELQAFVKKYGKDERAYDTPTRFLRND